MKKLAKKKTFRKVMGIVSIGHRLLKTVGLLAVDLNLSKLRMKNLKK